MILSMLTCFENMQADGRVLTGVEMKELTTMRVGGKADCVVFAGSVEDVRKTVQLCRENGIPLTVVGRGSNLIVRDGGLRGVEAVRMEPEVPVDADLKLMWTAVQPDWTTRRDDAACAEWAEKLKT